MVRKKLAELKTWRDRLDFAIHNELFLEEKDFLNWKACNWKCCAVGENRVALERAGIEFYSQGTPRSLPFPFKGEQAYRLGVEFNCAIRVGNYAEAMKVLSEIEQLSKEP